MLKNIAYTIKKNIIVNTYIMLYFSSHIHIYIKLYISINVNLLTIDKNNQLYY